MHCSFRKKTPSERHTRSQEVYQREHLKQTKEEKKEQKYRQKKKDKRVSVEVKLQVKSNKNLLILLIEHSIPFNPQLICNIHKYQSTHKTSLYIYIIHIYIYV